MQDFRKVRAWESAVLVATKTREVVARFPRHGYAELREQMVSAAESIVNNIAEGRSAGSPKEFVRFLDLAARSASELSAQLELAKRYGIVDQRTAFSLMGSIICTRRMIRALQKAVRESERRAKATRARVRKAVGSKGPATEPPKTRKRGK